MAITLRNVKGTELTHAEGDQNFIDLRDGVALMVPSGQTYGLKVDSLGTPTFGWHDQLGTVQVYGEAGDAIRATYRGGIKALQFVDNVSDSAYVDFHIPHDYVMGSDIFIHAHWSHNSALVTGGSVTWGFELMYAKGHDQAPFGTPVIVSVNQAASTIQYQHMIAEGIASTPGGSATLLDTTQLEADGLIQCRIYLDSNDLTVSGGGIPNPFVHTVDIHYQSTGVPTKNKAPSFWG